MYKKFVITRCPFCRRPLGSQTLAKILDLPVEPIIEVREARGRKGLPIVEKFTPQKHHPYYVRLKERYDLISPCWRGEKMYTSIYDSLVRPTMIMM